MEAYVREVFEGNVRQHYCQMLGLGCSGDRNQKGCTGIESSNQWQGKVAILEVHELFDDNDQQKLNELFLTSELSTSLGQLNQTFVQVVWEFVHNPNSSEETRIYYKRDSSQYWCQIFLTGLPNGLSRIEQKRSGQDWQNATYAYGQIYEPKCDSTELELKFYDADGLLYTPEVKIQAPQEEAYTDHFLVNTTKLVPNVLSSNQTQNYTSTSSTNPQVNQTTNSSTPITPSSSSTTSKSTDTSGGDQNVTSSSSVVLPILQTINSSSNTQFSNTSTSIKNPNVQISSSSKSTQVKNSNDAESTTDTSTIRSNQSEQQISTSSLINQSNFTTSQPSSTENNQISQLSSLTTSKPSFNESLSSQCSSLCIPDDLCQSEFKHSICICDPDSTLDYFISLTRLQCCNPIIRIKFNHQLQRKLTTHTQSLNFTFATTQIEEEGQVDIELLALEPQLSSCINVKIIGRQGNKSQKLMIPFTFQQNDVGNQNTLRWLQVLRNVSKKLSRNEVKMMSYFGMFSVFQKSSQALAQLIFLNSTDPLLVYEFERIVAIWTLDKTFPEWEDIFNNHTVQLYTLMKVYETKNEQLLEAGLFRYSRGAISQNIFLNLEENLLFGFFLLITLYLVNSFSKTQQTPQDVIKDLFKLASQIQCSNEKIIGLNYLIEKMAIQIRYDQLLVFAFLSMSLESKLCLYIHSIYLNLGYPNFSEIIGFSSILFCFIFMVVYIAYHIIVIHEIRQLLVIKGNIQDSNFLYVSQQTLLINYLEDHLRNRYRFFLLDKKLNNNWTIYSTFGFIIKKWIFGVTIVCLYGKVVVQIGLLIAINLLAMIYRLVIRPYRSFLINILHIVGDQLFIVILGFKLGGFTRYSELIEQAINVQKFKQWQDQGQYTMIMEMCYLFLYMVVLVARIVIYINERNLKQRIMKENNERLREIVSMIGDPAGELGIFYGIENFQSNHWNYSGSSDEDIDMPGQQQKKYQQTESCKQQKKLHQQQEKQDVEDTPLPEHSYSIYED